LDSTFDMSDTGCIYRIIIDVRMVTDLIPSNDQYTVDVKSQRKTGSIVLPLVRPNDTICSGDPVRLEVKDFYGSLQWEVKVERANVPASWSLGFNFPSRERYYDDNPDTNTTYRVRVCRELFTAPFNIDETTSEVEVVAIKPALPVGIDDSKCEDETRVLTLGALVPGNITRVDLFDSLTGGTLLATDNSSPYEFTRNGPKLRDTLFLRSTIQDQNLSHLDPRECTSRSRGMVIATINPLPTPLNFKANDTLCGDLTTPLERSSVLLDGGQRSGEQWDYLWTRQKLPAGPLDTFITQTVSVDAWLLDLNATYRYILVVRTDSGCPAMGLRDTTDIFIDDFCITSIDEQAFKQSFGIYPNPVSDELSITHESLENFKGTIRLMTADGQLIESFEEIDFGKLNKQIDMGSLPKGVYIIKVDSERGSFVEKIIKS